MNDAQLYSLWLQALLLATTVVLIAAGLLIGIILAARRILRLAGEALARVEKIKNNTQGIWALKETNRKAARALEQAQAIREQGAALAQALHREDDENAA